jgi:hypothetical protein
MLLFQLTTDFATELKIDFEMKKQIVKTIAIQLKTYLNPFVSFRMGNSEFDVIFQRSIGIKPKIIKVISPKFTWLKF